LVVGHYRFLASLAMTIRLNYFAAIPFCSASIAALIA
jgi:hypothetical protein